jgi:hypothetical protein
MALRDMRVRSNYDAVMRAACWCLLLVGCGRLGFTTIAGDAGDAGDAATPPPDSADQDLNLVFVTSTRYVASTLTSLAQADAICAQRAAAAGLPGQFVAWIALEGIDPRDRLSGARGWQRPDGAVVADRVEDLLEIGPLFPLLIDELGNDTGVASLRALTGTSIDGTAHADRCATTSMIRGGRTWRTYSAWTSHASQGCDIEGPLYCFGIDRDVPMTLVPATGRRAFVTAPQFSPGSTLAAADQLCATEASLGGLTGTFRALVGTSSMAAASRFDPTGPPWVRLDGIELAASAAAFLRGEQATSLNVDSEGFHTTYLVATGGAVPNDPGTATCADWTTSIGTHRVGDSNAAAREGFDARTNNCNVPFAVYCLEP